jgi:YVTN family beta-propeller protein
MESISRNRRSMLLGTAIFVFSIAGAQAQVLLVVNKNENALAVVDPVSKKILAHVPVGDGPHEVEASADGKLAFVSNYGIQNGATAPGTSISIIDIAGRQETGRIDLGARSRPHGLYFTKGKLYFTAEGHKLIGSYDPGTKQVDWRLGTGQNRTHLVRPNKDLTRFYTSNIGSNTVTVIERAPEPLDWTETVIPVGKGPEGIDMSPDEKEVWTAHGGDGGVSVIDTAAKKVVQTLDLHMTRPNRLKFTKDGKRVLISDLGGDRLLILDAATRKEIKRMDVGKSPEGMLMAPDRIHAYIAATGSDSIAVLDVNTLEVTDRITSFAAPDGLAWVDVRP